MELETQKENGMKEQEREAKYFPSLSQKMRKIRIHPIVFKM